MCEKEKTKYEKILEQYFSSSKKKVPETFHNNGKENNTGANHLEKNSPRKRCYSNRSHGAFKNYSQIQSMNPSNCLQKKNELGQSLQKNSYQTRGNLTNGVSLRKLEVF